MAVTHYDPFQSSYNEDYVEVACCGTPVGENYEGTNNKNFVTCKKCKKAFVKIDAEINAISKHLSEQDAAFVDFVNEKKSSPRNNTNI